MSTRSRIAIKIGEGYESIYCHHDGYPEGVGATLREHYTDPIKVQALINLGDISLLRAEIGVKRDWSEARRDDNYDGCVAYGRDRGEKGVDKVQAFNLWGLKTQAKNSDGEYLYLFTDGEWKFAKGYSYKSFRPLTITETTTK